MVHFLIYQYLRFNISTSDFKLGKSNFLANFDVSTPVAFFKSAFVT